MLCAIVYIVPGRCLQRPQPDSCPTQTNPSHTRDKSKKKRKRKKNIIIIQGPENSVKKSRKERAPGNREELGR